MDEHDYEPVICPECGGTGCHPWKAEVCTKCNGTGELTDDVYDERYKITRYRATSGCCLNEMFV